MSMKVSSKEEELETMDRIVKAINQEVSLGNVFDALLEQAIKLFVHAEAGSFLIRDSKTNLFKFAAAKGHNMDKLKDVVLTEDDISGRSSSGKKKELMEDVYILNLRIEDYGQEKFKNQRLKGILENVNGKSSLEEIVKLVVTEVKNFEGKANQHDDITVLGIKMMGNK